MISAFVLFSCLFLLTNLLLPFNIFIDRSINFLFAISSAVLAAQGGNGTKKISVAQQNNIKIKKIAVHKIHIFKSTQKYIHALLISAGNPAQADECMKMCYRTATCDENEGGQHEKDICIAIGGFAAPARRCVSAKFPRAL
ncbi:hypothetical protein LJC27_06025 [Christensenellaceae bacterium OttesenSCG-928-M15]|nr:hypothetical protein [Christensenellaceae bacterium OttesenSCG-928-M15]